MYPGPTQTVPPTTLSAFCSQFLVEGIEAATARAEGAEVGMVALAENRDLSWQVLALLLLILSLLYHTGLN